MEDETLRGITEKYIKSIKLQTKFDAVKDELRKRKQLLERTISSSLTENELIANWKGKLWRSKCKIWNQLTKNKFSIYLKDCETLENKLKDITDELQKEKLKNLSYEEKIKDTQIKQTPEKE